MNNNSLTGLSRFLCILGVLLILCYRVFPQASCLCQNNQMNATPFCTDQNPYGVSYTAGTSGYANELYYLNTTGCLDRYSGAPNPVWYKMRISVPGDLTIYMSHSNGGDIDYACWGPFTDQQMNSMCSNYTSNPSSIASYLYDYLPTYNYCQDYSHNPNNYTWNYDWYTSPSGTLVDCSSTPDASEWVHIRNAQVGQWYILLISNWGSSYGTINFSRMSSSTAATDCTITAPITGDEVCEGATATISAMSLAGAVYYYWTGPNGFTQTTTTNTLTIPNITLSQGGTYGVQVWNGSSYGNMTQCDVIVHPNPVLTVAQDVEICSGQSATLNVQGADTYLWNTGATDANYTVSPTATTTYQVTGTTFGMCTGTASSTVIVFPNYNMHFYDTICQGAGYNRYGFTLTAEATNSAGEQTLNQTYPSLHQCDSSVTVYLTILPAVTATIDTAICEGETLTVGNQSYTETGTYTQVQQNTSGCDSTVIIHLVVNPAYRDQITVAICENDLPYYCQEADTTFDEGTRTGDYQFGGVTRAGCDSIFTVRLEVYPIYDNEAELEICASHLPYRHTSLNYTFDTNTPEDTLYHFALTSSHGCDSNVTLHVTVTQDEIDLQSLTEDFCEENFALLQVTTPMPAVVWSTGETTPQITVNRPGTYIVTALSGACQQSRQILIPACELNLYLPNAISPSMDDGTNDYFYIEGRIAAQLLDFEIYIFDRWGRIVFRSQDPYFKWYGYSNNGKLLSNSVFSYMISFKDFNGARQLKRGTITVL